MPDLDDDFEYDDEIDDGDEIDELEEALANCGRMPDGTCQLAGSEECEFECPLSDLDDPFEDDELTQEKII